MIQHFQQYFYVDNCNVFLLIVYQGTFETLKQNIEKNCSLENNNFILKFQNKLKLKDNK